MAWPPSSCCWRRSGSARSSRRRRPAPPPSPGARSPSGSSSPGPTGSTATANRSPPDRLAAWRPSSERDLRLLELVVPVKRVDRHLGLVEEPHRLNRVGLGQTVVEAQADLDLGTPEGAALLGRLAA